MDDITLEALGYHEVLGELEGFAVSPPARGLVRGLRPGTDRSGIEEAFAELTEMGSVLKASGPLPFDGIRDIGPLLSAPAPEGAYFTPPELFDIKETIEAISRIKSLVDRSFSRAFPVTSSRIGTLSDHKALRGELSRVLDEKGHIRDEASAKLREIRGEVLSSRERGRAVLEKLTGSRELSGVFTDEISTIRDDRYVLLVKAGRHAELPGVVHGRSASGATYFVEPFQVVELNNRIAILKKEEKTEEVKILKAATARVIEERDIIMADLSATARLDLAQAKALFKEHIQAVVPLIKEGGEVKLTGARHPLLVFKELKRGAPVVPVDIRLRPGSSVLVISGANAGGKTVALKTLGLLSLMAQTGLAIPAEEGSELNLFNNVFSDIGDRQDIAEDLSTFSAHLKRLGEILEAVSPPTLVLVDEIGVGTDPAEGGVLALAMLETLSERGATTVVTTHLNILKARAQTDPAFENAAVEFDEETTRPRYKLGYGVPGPSLGLSVARNYGIPDGVIKRAREMLEGDEGEFIRSVRALEEEKGEVRALREG
ncbi:MAG: endonuclease MutS2, partial [Thermodesulfobacteriota bacterium]